MRVLVVDDNATNRRILEEILSHWGLEVLSTDNGTAALKRLHAESAAGQPVPLVVTDMQMPIMDGFGLVERIRQSNELSRTKVIMLTSSLQSGQLARCEELGLAAHLMKPVKQDELLAAILLAAEQEPNQVPSPEPWPPHRDTPSLPALRILLAEDGLANQKLAVGLLSSWGHDVTVARDGKEALNRWEAQPFDLVLMDVQMPELDGYAATREIRLRELGTGTHIPIVAMTAHALSGDREKCLAAGMDDYVAKPIRKKELLAAIAPFFID